MNKIVSVLTTNRSDYGLLRNIIMKLQSHNEFETDVLVTGSHLSSFYGNTVQEIESDSIRNIKKIPIYSDISQADDISLVMSNTIITFSTFFNDHPCNFLLVLGDRYETFAVCVAALNHKIPIGHIHGGELSEGALDNYYRHCITKMSYLHFTSLESYRSRVIQLGEAPERVFYVGAPGVENALKIKLLTKTELENNLCFDLEKPYAVVTYHPVSMENNTAISSLEELLLVLKKHTEMNFIITYSNIDKDGTSINLRLEQFQKECTNILLVKSLGMVRYLSALKYATMIIGNSSSGILEAPSFHIPTINIGTRQKGRIHASTVIDCNTHAEDIESAIQCAFLLKDTPGFKEISNPYEQKDTSDKIVEIISTVLKNNINLEKKFFDLH